jgi:hypothetical protein
MHRMRRLRGRLPKRLGHAVCGREGVPSGPTAPGPKWKPPNRVQAMVAQMDAEGFGNCSNQSECEAVCPKEISVDFIAQLNREYLKTALK